MNSPLFFESAGDERGTPQDFFDRLNAEFHFDLDVAASSKNHKCPTWFGEGGVANDAMGEDWGGLTCFCNPPYSVAGGFVLKAREEADKGATVVNLLPVRSDTKWWHQYVWSNLRRDWYPGVECRFISGRLNFTLSIEPAHRAWITESLKPFPVGGTERADAVKQLVELTGLPKMALERICLDWPDEDLLDAAPFPSCVVIFEPIH